MRAYEIKPNCFCKGVENAIKTIDSLLKENKLKKPIYMLGYLVHNSNVVSYFEDQITIIRDNFIQEINSINEGTVIITAHGISPKIISLLKEKKLNIIDTTCANVKKIHSKINEYLNKDYKVFIIGDKNHPEVKGYLGISDNVQIYNNSFNTKFEIKEKIYITTQTTLIYDDVMKECSNIINTNRDNIVIEEKVCLATERRQKALLDCINDYDLFIIVGDKLSNNCKSLYDLVLHNNKKAIMITNVDDLNDFNIKDYQKIGVTGGASTPISVLKEIINEINDECTTFKSKLIKSDYIKF